METQVRKLDETERERGKRRYSQLAQAYNEGYDQGGQEEALRRLREKIDELSAQRIEKTKPQ